MSATREILCEKICLLEVDLEKAIEHGDNGSDTNIEHLRNEILSLRKQLNVINRALNEGLTILKG